MCANCCWLQGVVAITCGLQMAAYWQTFSASYVKLFTENGNALRKFWSRRTHPAAGMSYAVEPLFQHCPQMKHEQSFSSSSFCFCFLPSTSLLGIYSEICIHPYSLSFMLLYIITGLQGISYLTTEAEQDPLLDIKIILIINCIIICAYTVIEQIISNMKHDWQVCVCVCVCGGGWVGGLERERESVCAYIHVLL